jgi:hypothetical protein
MMEIHRSVVEGINNGRTDANLGPSASRVAVNTSGTTVFACCHNQVYNIPVPSSIFTKNDCDTSTTTSTTTISAKPIIHPNSMAIPNSLHTHESPVQSVICKHSSNQQTLLASVDTYGRLKWSDINKVGTNQEEVHNITRQLTANIESGWSGISFGPSNQVAVVQHFDRTLSVGNLSSEKFVRTAHLSGCPTDVGFCGGGGSGVSDCSGQLVATTENNAVVLYDLRSGASADATTNLISKNRQTPSFAKLRSIVTPNSWPANILTASDDRFVYTIEPRNWRVLRRWRTPLKYEPVSLLRSPSHDELCYIAGLDNDIMCGNVGSETKTGGNGQAGGNGGNKKRKREFTQLQMMFSTGFRGDGPWSGVAVRKDGDNDVLYAVSQCCGLYVVKGSSGLLEMRYSNE